MERKWTLVSVLKKAPGLGRDAKILLGTDHFRPDAEPGADRARIAKRFGENPKDLVFQVLDF